MQCAQGDVAGKTEYLDRWRARIVRERVPLQVSIDLTSRCNLRCVHCYLGRRREEQSRELPTSRLLEILDSITDLGCLFLLFTGGEALLRDDFEVLYRRAKMNGMFVTVFSNGTTVTERTADLFAELPPQVVEISIYGASVETYQAITGNGNAFAACIRGIETLLKRGVKVRLKTMLLTLNGHQFEEMERIAERYGVPFRFDGILSPTLDSCLNPTRFRLSPEELVEKEFSTAERREAWERFREKATWRPDPRLLYNCAAGLNTFHVRSDGLMQPCIMSTEPSFDLQDGDLETGWRHVMPTVSQKAAPNGFPCNRCDSRTICSFCPPAFAAEAGERAPAFHCDLAERRRQELRAY